MAICTLLAFAPPILSHATNEAAHGRDLRLESLNLTLLHFLRDALRLQPYRAPILPLLIAIDEVTLPLLYLLFGVALCMELLRLLVLLVASLTTR